MVLSCTVSEIRWLIGWKLPIFATFLLPLSHSAPLLPRFPLEFCGEVNPEDTRVMGLSYSEDRTIVAGVVLAWYQRVTDVRTDGQTVRETESIMANTAHCALHSKLCWRAAKTCLTKKALGHGVRCTALRRRAYSDQNIDQRPRIISEYKIAW